MFNQKISYETAAEYELFLTARPSTDIVSSD